VVERLLIFEGAPGAGKSTLSEFAAEQLGLNGMEAHWLEEHVLDSDHFAEFMARRDDLQAASKALLADWDRLIERLQAWNGYALLDGAYFGNTLKCLFAGGMGADDLQRLAREVEARLAPFNPTIVYLSGDPRNSVGRAIEQRGGFWAEHIARDVETYPCQKAHGRRGAGGMVDFFIDAYALFDEILERTSLPVFALSTEEGDWPAAEAALLASLGLERRAPSAAPTVELERYVGTYQPPDGFPAPYDTPLAVERVGDELRMHAVFYHNFRLVPEAATRFRMKTAPWIVEFELDGDGEASALIYPFVKDARHVCRRVSKTPTRPALE